MNNNDDRQAAQYQSIVAQFLSASGLDFCHRATLRALLPAGTTKKTGYTQNRYRAGNQLKTKNRVSDTFQKLLCEFENLGLIQRGERFIRVLDRAGLVRLAAERPMLAEGRIALIDRAIQIVQEQLTRERLPRVVEMRRLELIALQRLMTDIRGDHWSGRDSVRFVPRGQVI